MASHGNNTNTFDEGDLGGAGPTEVNQLDDIIKKGALNPPVYLNAKVDADKRRPSKDWSTLLISKEALSAFLPANIADSPERLHDLMKQMNDEDTRMVVDLRNDNGVRDESDEHFDGELAEAQTQAKTHDGKGKNDYQVNVHSARLVNAVPETFLIPVRRGKTALKKFRSKSSERPSLTTQTLTMEIESKVSYSGLPSSNVRIKTAEEGRRRGRHATHFPPHGLDKGVHIINTLAFGQLL